MRVPASSYRCPQCGNREVIRRGFVDRMNHAPQTGFDRTVLFIKTLPLKCRRCQQVLNSAVPGIESRCNDTKSFARMVVDLRQLITDRDVAQWMGGAKE